MNMVVRYYSEETGVVLPGWQILPDEDAIAQNTPVGHRPTLVAVDHKTQRFDVATGEIVPYEPPVVVLELDEPTARAERDRLLAACDWVTSRAIDLQLPVPEAWRVYRQALRDLPDQPGFPASISWPSPPSS